MNVVALRLHQVIFDIVFKPFRFNHIDYRLDLSCFLSLIGIFLRCDCTFCWKLNFLRTNLRLLCSILLRLLLLLCCSIRIFFSILLFFRYYTMLGLSLLQKWSSFRISTNGRAKWNRKITFFVVKSLNERGFKKFASSGPLIFIKT